MCGPAQLQKKKMYFKVCVCGEIKGLELHTVAWYQG